MLVSLLKDERIAQESREFKHLHEQTGLTTGTIAHDDKLAADLGHLGSEEERDQLWPSKNKEVQKDLRVIRQAKDGGYEGRWSV